MYLEVDLATKITNRGILQRHPAGDWDWIHQSP
jgi:hypothetical protein